MALHFVESVYASPIGNLKVRGCQRGVSQVLFADIEEDTGNVPNELAPCFRLLDQYFQKQIEGFHNLELAYAGSSFELDVWEALLNVPYGSTVSYSDLANDIGNPKAARAVGNALNRNPLHIIVPCHRVLPCSGDCGNYAAGPDKKQWLLDHESAIEKIEGPTFE